MVSVWMWLGLTGTALGAPAFGGDVLTELLVPGEVVADGATGIPMQVVALNAEGQPIKGLELKAAVPKCEVSDVTNPQPGIYAFTVTPPAVSAPTEWKVRVSGKNEVGDKLSVKGVLDTIPAYSRQMQLTLAPAEGFTLGERDQATLFIDFPEMPGKPIAPSDLTLLVSEGTVENLTDMGEGRFSALYRPPEGEHPTLALFTVVDSRAPEISWAYGVLPLSARTEVPLRGKEGENVLLQVGDKSYGPFPMPKEGEVMVTVELGPGARTGTKIVIGEGGQRTEEEVELELPPVRRVQLFPLPKAMAADPQNPVPVRALVANPDGTLAEGASVSFGSTVGTATAGRPAGPGIYEGRFTPEPGNALQTATFQVSLDGEDEVQVHAMDFQRVPVRPRTVTLTPQPAVVDTGKVPFSVRIDVKGPNDTVLGDREVVLNAVGAKVESVKASKDGGYLAQLKALGNGPVELKASVPTPGSENPLHRVLLFPSKTTLVNNGISNVMVTALTVDRLGYPVPGVAVSLSVDGDASLPTEGTTDAAGLLQLFLSAGREPGLLSLQAMADGHVARTYVVQHEGQLPADVRLPDVGDVETTAWTTLWRSIVTETLVQRK